MKMEPLKILLVDDEEELVSALVERLALRGIEADAVTRGEDAVDRVRDNQYDVVVLDLKLPDVDGLVVMQRIKALRPSVPVVLFTGHGSVGKSGHAALDQAYDYMAKPIEIEQFIEKIRAAADSDVSSGG